jgi:hypothetical protein
VGQRLLAGQERRRNILLTQQEADASGRQMLEVAVRPTKAFDLTGEKAGEKGFTYLGQPCKKYRVPNGMKLSDGRRENGRLGELGRCLICPDRHSTSARGLTSCHSRTSPFSPGPDRHHRVARDNVLAGDPGNYLSRYGLGLATMDKQQRKALVKSWKDAERARVLSAMPMTSEQLHQLLDYLDANLKSCDHTTKLTAIFLQVENLEREKVLSWLAEHGGYCDCEVLANLEDLDDSLQAPPPAPRVRIQSKQNRVPRDLQTVTGWNLANLPAPWRVANLYLATEPVQLQLGKKSGCAIHIVEAPLPSGDRTSDEFWTRLWYARTELPPKGSLQVSHGLLDLPETLQSTLVQSPSWIPVYCWIVPKSNSWYLEVRTESRRCAGDLPQISSLISRLARGQA